MNAKKDPAPQNEGLRLGFLCSCQHTLSDGFIGGLLVTNEVGLPLEFRSTEPIIPTVGQRILYGNTLEPHVKVDLIADTLFKESKEKPHILLTDEKLLLQLQPRVEIPVVWVRSQELGWEDESMAMIGSTRFPGIVVKVHDEYKERLSEVQKLLLGSAEKMDLLDPFERIHRALEEVSKKKK